MSVRIRSSLCRFSAAYALALGGYLAASTAAAQEPVPVAEELPAALIDAAGEADRFEREAALYRFLAEVDQAAVLAFLDAVGALPEPSFRAAVSGPLYVRLAHFDAEAAVERVLAGSGGPSDLVVVIRAWAHVDLAAAVAHATTLQPPARKIATRTVLELDLSAAQRDWVLSELGGGENGSLADTEVISTVDDTWAAAWSKALQAKADDRRQLAELAAAWAALDPEAAMEMAAQLTTLKDVRVQEAVVEAWGANDPRGPIGWLAQYAEAALEDHLGSPGESVLPLDFNLAPLAMRILAEKDPDGSVSLLQELPKPMRRRSLLGLANSFAENEPDRAITLYESLEDPEAKRDILRAMALHTTWDGGKLDWLASLREQPDVVEHTIETAYLQDRALVLGWLAELDDPDQRAAAASAIVDHEAERDPRAAWRWAGGFETERYALLVRVYRQWYAADGQAATRAIVDMPDRESRARVASRAIEWLLDVEGPQDSGAGERLFKVVESEALRQEAAQRFVDYFMDTGDERAVDRYRRSLASGGR
ncbi:MAG: hypothetical protein OXQ90_05270 [Gammaproteobacteria bacterium]|nr:hypothetical protein [Gammaproteobacteria bacterium]